MRPAVSTYYRKLRVGAVLATKHTYDHVLTPLCRVAKMTSYSYTISELMVAQVEPPSCLSTGASYPASGMSATK